MSKCKHETVIEPDPTSEAHEIVRCSLCGATKRRVKHEGSPPADGATT